MLRQLVALGLLASLAACAHDGEDPGARPCGSELACHPDETCTEGLCTQTECTAAADCGPDYQYACEAGGCVVASCTVSTDCELGFQCTGGYCAVACEGVDADRDGICDPEDNCAAVVNPDQLDSDGDLVGDACDSCAYDPDNDADGDTICGDLDNCPSVSNTSQLDGDGDGMGDDCDADGDGDGVIDSLDPAPLDPNVCGDSDQDTCDDCSGGSFAPGADGLDTDRDGACDAGDPDDDNDTVLDEEDPFPIHAQQCGDSDGDTCDDCDGGTFDPAADGLDTDGDGACDAGDPDDDNDGIGDDEGDNFPLDPMACQDMDNDGCDDCAIGVDGFGPLPDNNPENDGPDADGDGSCNGDDWDDDNDGRWDIDDWWPDDPSLCGDFDFDGCDDCAIGFDGFGIGNDVLPENDGPDADGDGLCDLGDDDDDDDGVLDAADTCPAGQTGWSSNAFTDADADGCADAGEDCSSSTALCGADCTDTDGDQDPDCLEQYCGSDPADPASTC